VFRTRLAITAATAAQQQNLDTANTLKPRLLQVDYRTTTVKLAIDLAYSGRATLGLLLKQKYSLIIISLILIVSIIAPAAFVLQRYTEDTILEFERSELEYLADAVLFSLPKIRPEADYDEQISQLDHAVEGLATSLHARITLTDINGKVLADSVVDTADLASVESHADRPEIAEASKHGKGYSVRYSETAATDVINVAVRMVPVHSYSVGGTFSKSIIVRTSRPLSLINELLTGFSQQLFKVSAAVIFLVLMVSTLGMLYLNRQMKQDSDSLEERVAQRTEEIVMLQMLSALLNTCASLDEASKVLSELAPKLLPGSSGGISIFKASRNRLDLLSSWGDDFNSNATLAQQECWALRKGHQHVAYSQGVLLPCDHWHGDASGTMCIPLVAQGETVAVLHLNYLSAEACQQTDHVREAIAEQTGLTLANIQLRHQLRDQARRDPMTGLYNRLYLLESMEEHFDQPSKPHTSSAMLMIDADHFKRFNDNFGHAAGDLVLKNIAHEIRRVSGESAVACRYGGEEFCVFITDIDRENACILGEEIRSAVSELSLSINNLPLGAVTVSIGIALAPEYTESSKDIITLSDNALYSAKEAGRDRVMIYHPENNTGAFALKKAS